jgi:dTMP kinase
MFLPRDSGLICCEGLDAAGKQTQTRKLAARFDGLGITAVMYSFPRYTTTVGKAILRHLKGEIELMQEETDAESSRSHVSTSEDALAFQCLMLADKMDAAVDIWRHMQLGHVVICDRWWQSALAFGAADGLDVDWLHRIHALLPPPWLNVFIDVPPEEALRRRPEARDRYERDREKQKIVRANYEQLWTNAGPDYVKIDGVGTEDEVHTRIWSALENRP